MRVHLAQQVQAILGHRDLVIITERVDDVALRIGQMVKMGFVEVLARPIPRPGKQRGISGGWTAVSWLASLLTAGDHRPGAVEAYIKGRQTPRSRLSPQGIAPRDCSADRLGPLLTPVSQPTDGQRSEEELQAHSLAGYALLQDVLRCEATTGSGEHDRRAGGR
jgi:hypothetical protein